MITFPEFMVVLAFVLIFGLTVRRIQQIRADIKAAERREQFRVIRSVAATDYRERMRRAR